MAIVVVFFSLLCYEKDDNNCHRLLLRTIWEKKTTLLPLFFFSLVCCEEDDDNRHNLFILTIWKEEDDDNNVIILFFPWFAMKRMMATMPSFFSLGLLWRRWQQLLSFSSSHCFSSHYLKRRK
jgi:hypothetical protein